jgi:cytochrome b
MARVLIFDLPVRLFHWLLAGGILLAFGIARFGDEDGALFPYHAMIGIVLGALLVLRPFWGFVGTRYARFRSFLFGPAAVARDLKGVVTGKADAHVGHSPASSWAIFIMYAGVATVVGSGLMMTAGSEAAEAVHEIAVYALLAVAAVHVAGVIVHTVRQRDNITLSMITGRKNADEQAAIRSAAPVPALLGLTIVAMLAGTLLWNYDPATKRTALPLVGTSIRLSEGEHHAPEPADHHEEH